MCYEDAKKYIESIKDEVGGVFIEKMHNDSIVSIEYNEIEELLEILTEHVLYEFSSIDEANAYSLEFYHVFSSEDHDIFRDTFAKGEKVYFVDGSVSDDKYSLVTDFIKDGKYHFIGTMQDALNYLEGNSSIDNISSLIIEWATS